MEGLLTAFLGFITAILGIVLGMVALSGKFKTWVVNIIHETLWSIGFLERDPKKKVWPNGYDDLREFLEGIHNDIKAVKKAVAEHVNTTDRLETERQERDG